MQNSMILIGRTLALGDVEAKLALVALTKVAFRDAQPVEDDGVTHPEYRPNDRLALNEALEMVAAAEAGGLAVLFLRGRYVCLAVKAHPTMERAYVVSYDGGNLAQAVDAARRHLNDLEVVSRPTLH